MVKWNDPGNTPRYKWYEPFDNVLRAKTDELTRGYWLERDVDGQICFVSDQKPTTEAVGQIDPLGINELVIKDDALEIDFVTPGDILEIERYS